MKQIAKNERINGQLRAAYGPDADLNSLAVYEAVLLNGEPLRKAGGLFKNARASLSLLGELANWVNKESVPIQLVHDTSELPYGRLFYAEVVNDELRGLFAIDGANHADLVSKIDNGTLNQVSVGFNPKKLSCSKCGYDYLAPGHEMALWTMECSEGHTLNQDGTFLWVDGLEYFFELSLVGMGAAKGASIVGRNDSVLADNPVFQQRLAASANGHIAGVRLSPSDKEDSSMNTEQMAQFQAAVAEAATAKVQLQALQDQLTAAQAQITELNAREIPVDRSAELAEAVAALQAEAKAILTACGEEVPAELPSAVGELTALIGKHRAQFAALIPPGGASNKEKAEQPAPRSSAAFSTRHA